MALERLQLLIEASAGDATRTIRGVGDASQEAGVKQRFLSSESNLARTALDQMGLAGVSTTTALKGVAVAGGAMAAVGLAKFAIDSAEAFVGLADEVRGFSQATGTSAEDASRWVAAADDMGVSAEGAEKAAFKLNETVGEGGDALAKFGVEVERNKDGTVDLSETLLNVADAYASTSDSGEQAQLVTAAFGKAGKELIPILEQGRDGIKALFEGAEEGHQIFSQEDLDNAREYSLAVDDLQDSLRGFQLVAGQAVVPILTNIASTAANVVTGFDAAAQSVGGLGNVMSTAVDFTPLGNALHLASAGAELLQGNVGAAAGQFARSIPVVGGFVSTIFGGGEATNKFAEAQEELDSALLEMGNLAAAGKTGTDEYRDAMHRAEEASALLEGGQRKVAESFQSTADEAAIAQAAILNQAAATLAVSGSFLGLQTSLDGLETSQRAVEVATIDHTLAVLAANEAGGQNAELNGRVAQTSEAVSDAQRNLQGSNLQVAQAYLGLVAAAGERAVQMLGPEASAQEQNRAKTDAQRAAQNQLEAAFPGLRAQVEGYTGDLGKIPPEKKTEVWLGGAEAAVARAREVQYAIEQIRDKDVHIGIHIEEVRNRVTYDVPGAGGSTAFSDRNMKANVRPVVWGD